MIDMSRGGSYIDDGNGPVHVDDLPKTDAPATEPAPELIPGTVFTEPTVQETTDV